MRAVPILLVALSIALPLSAGSPTHNGAYDLAAEANCERSYSLPSPFAATKACEVTLDVQIAVSCDLQMYLCQVEMAGNLTGTRGGGTVPEPDRLDLSGAVWLTGFGSREDLCATTVSGTEAACSFAFTAEVEPYIGDCLTFYFEVKAGSVWSTTGLRTQSATATAEVWGCLQDDGTVTWFQME